ncbi:hypothetical protein CesoFtcFv8_005877 [Champsocephalus esox]|uniref:Uncharacterized protein n=2 Tax=Champsocephalus TaxID=52236 RepID=A0AAN8DTA9_CHAGU|nr:hypothetical protein CesoFtcFv8_005877 [Champsocephalus esox]KAK5928961.1 hypothetical protein CgunFtcFv8_010237 [Champsocephalus gunnari]
MVHSPAIIVVMIGRHMEPGGGSEEGQGQGGGLSLSAALQQKRARQLLSTVHTINDLEQRSGSGDVPKASTSKV